MPSVAAITAQHVAEQTRLARVATRDLLKLWPMWTPGDRASWERFSTAAEAVVRALAREAADESATFYETLRALHVSADAKPELKVVLGDVPPHEQLAASFVATGVVSTISALQAGFPMQAAMNTGFVRVSRAAERHVLNAGRQTITATAVADPHGAGWQRVTTGTCDFCEALAGEMNVEEIDFPAHDACECHAQPVFTNAATGSPTEAAPQFAEMQTNDGVFPTVDSMDADVQAAADAYFDVAYESTNAWLREGGGDLGLLPEDEADLVATLDRALADSASTEDATVFRGIDFDVDIAPGDFITDDAFVSTSLSRDTAASFARDEGTLLRIEVPAGTRTLGFQTAEDEVLLARGTRFEVIEVNGREVTLRVAAK